MSDIVNSPAHYANEDGEPEAIDQIRAMFERGGTPDGFVHFCVGCSEKYRLRAGRKLYPGKTAAESAAIDHAKARRYLAMARCTLGLGPDPRETS